MWTFLITDFDNTVRDAIPVTSFSFRQELNGVGGFSGTISNTGHAAVVFTNLEPGRSCIWALDPGGTPRYSGIIWAISYNVGADNSKISFGGSGRWSYAHHRVLETQADFTSPSDGPPSEIAASLLTTMEAAGASGLSYGWPTHAGTVYAPVYETYDYHVFGAAVEELAATATDGFDFDVDYEGNESTGLVPRFNAAYSRGLGTDLVFDTNSNMIVNSFACNAQQVANDVWVVGSGTGATKLVGRSTLTPVTYPLLQRVVGAGALDDTALLTKRAVRETTAASRCQQVINAEVYDAGDQQILGSFITGDTVQVSVDNYFKSITKERFRVASYSVKIDENGRNTINVQLVQDSVTTFGRIKVPDAWQDLSDAVARTTRLESQK